MADKKETKEETNPVWKALAYPPRVAIGLGSAGGTALEQALHNKGVIKSRSKTIQEGRGYDNAKRMAKWGVGLDDGKDGYLTNNGDKKEGYKAGGLVKRGYGKARK